MELSGLQTVAHLSFGRGHPVPTEEQAFRNSYLKKKKLACLYTLMILPKDITDIYGQRTDT